MLALIGVLPIAIVFTVYFAAKKRLWPVIVAHMIQDSLALATFVARGHYP